jgi:hypothetical protein
MVLKNQQEKELWNRAALAIAQGFVSHPNFALNNAPLDIGLVAQYADQVVVESRKRQVGKPKKK